MLGPDECYWTDDNDGRAFVITLPAKPARRTKRT